MNWLEYLRGYDDGQKDRTINRPPIGRGLLVGLFSFFINFLKLALMIGFMFLKFIYKLIKIIMIGSKK